MVVRSRNAVGGNTGADARRCDRSAVEHLALWTRARYSRVPTACARRGILDMHVFGLAGIVESITVRYAHRFASNRSQRSSQWTDRVIYGRARFGGAALVDRIEGQAGQALAAQGTGAVPNAHAAAWVKLVVIAACRRRGCCIAARTTNGYRGVRGAVIDLREGVRCDRDRCTASDTRDMGTWVGGRTVYHHHGHLALLANGGQADGDLRTGCS